MKFCVIALVTISMFFVPTDGATAEKGASETETRPASPLPGNPRVPYPPEASGRRIEGIVKYRAMIDESGAVLKVEILQVPKRDVGFEEAVRSTVKGWKFDPALHEGAPIPWIYNGELPFIGLIPYERARMYDRPSREMWLEIVALLEELGIDRATIDRPNGVLITQKTRFGGRKDKRPRAPDVGRGLSPREFELHVYVPRFIEPARVYVDSVIHTYDRIFYLTGVPEEWLFRKLEERTGARGYAIPDSPAGRSALARQLLDDEDLHPCYLKGGETPRHVSGPVSSPQRIQASYYKPVFPEGDRRAREESTLIMSAVIAEDGRVREVDLLNVKGRKGEFYASAMSAVSLWRYKPAEMDGCPVDVYFTIRVDFNFGR